MTYLEDAAAHLNQVAQCLDDPGLMPTEKREVRLRLADAYMRLAAIERGLPPCGHVARPEAIGSTT